MGIAGNRRWASPDTRNLAKALDAIGFEDDAESFMDDYIHTLAPSAMVQRLAGMIQETVEGINDDLYNRMNAMEREFYVCVEDLDFDYEQIASEYVMQYVRNGYGGYAAVDVRPTKNGVAIRQWDGERQTSKNSKTSSKQNKRKPAPKRKPASRRK